MPDSPTSRTTSSRPPAVGTVRSLRLGMCLLLLMTPAVCAQTQPEASDDGIRWSEPQDLLSGELKSQWKHFSSVDKTPMPAVWQRINHDAPETTELICTGNPRGFLYTSRQFGEFDLTLEWRYASDPNGNSGILIFTQNDQRLWPTSIQIQLHQPEAGSVFPSGDAVSDTTVRKEGLARPVGEWNQCRILSHSGRILVHINGKKAAEISGCKPASGCIAIQSEGSEVRFRRILIRTPLPPEESKTEPTEDADAAAE